MHQIDIWWRKSVCIILLLSQYTLFTVIRFDAIKGLMHAGMTMSTFVMLLWYHYMTLPTVPTVAGRLQQIPLKNILGPGSAGCISVFAVMMWCVDDASKQPALWSIAVFFEVLAVVLLGVMDMVDIHAMGERMSRRA